MDIPAAVTGVIQEVQSPREPTMQDYVLIREVRKIGVYYQSYTIMSYTIVSPCLNS